MQSKFGVCCARSLLMHLRGNFPSVLLQLLQLIQKNRAALQEGGDGSQGDDTGAQVSVASS